MRDFHVGFTTDPEMQRQFGCDPAAVDPASGTLAVVLGKDFGSKHEPTAHLLPLADALEVALQLQPSVAYSCVLHGGSTQCCSCELPWPTAATHAEHRAAATAPMASGPTYVGAGWRRGAVAAAHLGILFHSFPFSHVCPPGFSDVGTPKPPLFPALELPFLLNSCTRPYQQHTLAPSCICFTR